MLIMLKIKIMPEPSLMEKRKWKKMVMIFGLSIKIWFKNTGVTTNLEKKCIIGPPLILVKAAINYFFAPMTHIPMSQISQIFLFLWTFEIMWVWETFANMYARSILYLYQIPDLKFSFMRPGFATQLKTWRSGVFNTRFLI